jgi:hypothetical protein
MYLGIPLQPAHIKVIELTNRDGQIVKPFTCRDKILDMLDTVGGQAKFTQKN